MALIRKKILLVLGTRPEAIKLAPVIRALHEHSDDCLIKICITGQQREMLDQVLRLFNIEPDFDLNLMSTDQSLPDSAAKILTEVSKIVEQWRPDRVIVQGDTTTAFASSIASFYAKIPIAHIEAGLRTWRLDAPWPEEGHRKAISFLADLHFVPTESARQNLLKEGINESAIHLTGNTVVDAVLGVLEKIKTNASLRSEIAEKFRYLDVDKRLILVTGHRRESFGAGLEGLCDAIHRIVSLTDVQIVFPVHLNPHVQKTVHRMLSGVRNVFLLPPIEYMSFVYLMDRSYLVITDSGGIQEEAPSLHKPVVVTRNVTERTELLDAEEAILTGTDPETILKAVTKLLEDPNFYTRMSAGRNPFGDGKASERIVNQILKSS